MTYIKLEDVQKILKKNWANYYAVEKALDSLPFINPEEMIKEMIEEIKQKYRFKGIKEVGFEEVEEAVLDEKKILLLEKLLQKFNS